MLEYLFFVLKLTEWCHQHACTQVCTTIVIGIIPESESHVFEESPLYHILLLAEFGNIFGAKWLIRLDYIWDVILFRHPAAFDKAGLQPFLRYKLKSMGMTDYLLRSTSSSTECELLIYRLNGFGGK